MNRWDFESGSITKDAIGSADLINNGNVEPESEASEPNPPGYGTGGVILNGTDQFFSIPHWNSNEPWQSGQHEGTFAVAIKTPAAFSADMGYLLAKYSSNGQRSLAFGLNPDGFPEILIGFNNGTDSVKYDFSTALTHKYQIYSFLCAGLNGQNLAYACLQCRNSTMVSGCTG